MGILWLRSVVHTASHLGLSFPGTRLVLSLNMRVRGKTVVRRSVTHSAAGPAWEGGWKRIPRRNNPAQLYNITVRCFFQAGYLKRNKSEHISDINVYFGAYVDYQKIKEWNDNFNTSMHAPLLHEKGKCRPAFLISILEKTSRSDRELKEVHFQRWQSVRSNPKRKRHILKATLTNEQDICAFIHALFSSII